MKGLRIGWAVCGSFCTISAFCAEMEKIAEGNELVPVISDAVRLTDTRFGSAADVTKRIEDICGRRAISSIVEAEPLGPKFPLDIMLIAPCTGNTLAKITRGITDTPVTMAVKAHLREPRPLVTALCSNDAMSQNLAGIALLLSRRDSYLVPMKQDDPKKKPYSLVASASLLAPTAESALKGIQPRPLFL